MLTLFLYLHFFFCTKESQKKLLELTARHPRLFDNDLLHAQLDENQQSAVDELYKNDTERTNTLRGIGQIFKCIIEDVYKWNTDATKALLESDEDPINPLLNSEDLDASETVSGFLSAPAAAAVFLGKEQDEQGVL